jgi:hypothetical protein
MYKESMPCQCPVCSPDSQKANNSPITLTLTLTVDQTQQLHNALRGRGWAPSEVVEMVAKALPPPVPCTSLTRSIGG